MDNKRRFTRKKEKNEYGLMDLGLNSSSRFNSPTKRNEGKEVERNGEKKIHQINGLRSERDWHASSTRLDDAADHAPTRNPADASMCVGSVVDKKDRVRPN